MEENKTARSEPCSFSQSSPLSVCSTLPTTEGSPEKEIQCGSISASFLRSSNDTPQLSSSFKCTFKLLCTGGSSPANNVLLQLWDEQTVIWTSPVTEVHAALTSPKSVLLTTSGASSCRYLTDLKPSMTPKLSAKNELPPVILQFQDSGALEQFQRCLAARAPASFSMTGLNYSHSPESGDKQGYSWSHLDASDSTTVQTYFQYYGRMSNQMNMLQDSVRTDLYKQAIFSNPSDFAEKRVMDVGAGSGILSFFAAQTGAARVYAVEASSMVSTISSLAASNASMGSRLRVINKTVEALSLEKDLDHQKVDVLISEPIGTFLFNERMIESFLFARDAFLKPGGRLFPNRCRLYLAPFSDSQLYQDVLSRCSFWTNVDFYGINLSHTFQRALNEQFSQPIVDYINPNAIVCQAWHQEDFDLETIDRMQLVNMKFDFRFPISTPCLVHGIAGWFDVLFEGTDRHVGFSTAPWCAPTHWYQIRFLLKHPIAANAGQVITGTLRMAGNSQQSYFVTVDAHLEGTNISSSSAVIDLKDPDYRYYSNPQASYIPNTTTTTPPDTKHNNGLPE